MTLDDHDSDLERIETFPAFVKQAILRAEGITHLVDILGAVNSTQTAIGNEKRTAASEIEAEDSGEKWEYTQPMKGMRSYNNSGMFAALVSQLGYHSLTDLILFLLDADVLRLTWQWTNLEKLIRNRELFIRIAGYEISEGDPDWDMGEYWVKGSAGYKRVEDDE